jgi:predicted metalloprotease with PDZ domain
MMNRFRSAPFATAFLISIAAPAVAQSPVAPLTLALDATHAAQKYYRVHETLPAAPGPFTFVYPKWIPGYHGPVGPIEGVVSLHVKVDGRELTWRRDLVDAYAVHVDLPAGTARATVDFDVVGAPSHNGQNEPVSTDDLALVEFNNFVVYPQGATVAGIPVDATLTLPHGWTFGTALPVQSHANDVVTFERASLYTLVDSPVIAGLHERAFPLSATSELDVAADGAEAAAVSPKMLAGLKHLVAEGPALYGGEHYRDYHFLLTLSDAIGFEGIEHHESSDDRGPEKYATDDDAFRPSADLLPHEYSHSWNGKYRRPADLAVPDYQQPESTDLLWVYEGLNQYNGEKLATRARLSSFQDELDALAITAANMDAESGRAWRPIRDTADMAPFLYEAPTQYQQIRRSASDFYTEGDLIWLDADVTIRRQTNGARSLDDFCRLFAGGTSRAVPGVKPYDEAEIVSLLNRVAPYDWAGFFAQRIDAVRRRAPLDGIAGGGYELEYTDKPSDLFKLRETNDKALHAEFSAGLTVSTDGEADGTILDVRTDSPAFAAGLAPGMRILGVDGRKWSPDRFRAALRAHKGTATPMQIVATNDDFIRVFALAASMGERYPRLVRRPGTPDVLRRIYAPLTFTPDPEPAARS